MQRKYITMSHASKQQNRRQDLQNAIEKVVINAGVGRAGQQSNFQEKILPQIMRDIGLISGQKPETRPSRISIAGFKMREGQIVGIRVTLRRAKMVDFLERLITIVLPRVKDFRGLSLTNIDERGVLNIGFREQFVFPEVNVEESPFVFPLGVNIVPRRKSRGAAIETYRALGIPLKK